MKQILWTLSFLILINMTFAADCGGAVQCECGDTLIEDQVMWYDLMYCQDNAMVIGADEITLDCDGHNINSESTGIIIEGNNDVVVQNCDIIDSETGVSVVDSDATFIDNVDIMSLTGTTIVLGDVVQIHRGSDKLELNEFLGDVRRTITENELAILEGGTLTSGGHTTSYDQYLRLNFLDPQGIERNSAQIRFLTDYTQGIVSDVMSWNEGDYIFEYQLEFMDGFQSSIEGDGYLEDFVGEEIVFFGTEFLITDAAATQDNSISITLETSDLSDTLGEGETEFYVLDEYIYDITAVEILEGPPESASFEVNGEITP
ncbi:MAG: hypothetical protein KKG59_06225, partial [Nanoarchaeota archaeon]|nr:hypothetical protein [Nanoarchaeota archaeon]